MTTEHSIDIATAIERTESSGVTIGGYTMRMTCTEACFRDPSHEIHGAVNDLFAEVFDDSQFRVIQVEDKGTYAVFDGYSLMESSGIPAHIGDFDGRINEILATVDGDDRPEVALNVGFLGAQEEHVHGPDCDH